MQKIIIVLWAIALLALWSVDAPAQIGQDAPGFAAQDQDGKPVKLADLTGKVVVLEWINPECPFVQRHAEAGTMRGLAERYAKRGVVWLGVNTSKSSTNALNQEWAAKHKLGYPILNDAAASIGQAYGAKSTPSLCVIGPDAKLAYKGAIDNDPAGDKPDGERVNYVAKALDELLAGKAVSVPETKSYGCPVKYR
jgi:peroxiredoxin